MKSNKYENVQGHHIRGKGRTAAAAPGRTITKFSPSIVKASRGDVLLNEASGTDKND